MFFGDLYAIDAATGEKLWSQDLGESAAAYRERPAKSRRGGRLYNARLAHEDRGRKDRNPKPRGRLGEPPVTSKSGARAELR